MLPAFKTFVLYGVPVLFSAFSAGFLAAIAVVVGWWSFGQKTWLWEVSAIVLGGAVGTMVFFAALAWLGWRARILAKTGALAWWLVWAPLPIAAATLAFTVAVIVSDLP